MKARRSSGFALVITLVLLALLVLAIFALSALTKVGGEAALTGTYQTQARQNALLGLNVAVGELHRNVRADARVTGMAGVTNIIAGSTNTTRHWCGVWNDTGLFLAWLTSGAQTSAAALQPGVSSIELVANGSLGAPASNSEHVIAGKIPIAVSEIPASPGAPVTIGTYAYAVLDEGVKTAAYAPPPMGAIVPAFYAKATGDTARLTLKNALTANASSLPKVLSYEQLAQISSTITPSVLQDNFHHVTLSNLAANSTQLSSGMFNVNTNSVFAWRNLLQTYNSQLSGPTAQIAVETVADVITSVPPTVGGLTSYTIAGKAVNGPFTSIQAFTSYLATRFPLSGTPNYTQIMTAIGPMLTTRSDTFRIRSYGEALNPADSTKVEASAYCEAIVQRVKDASTPAGEGRFVITYFRWLAPPNPASSTQTDI